MKNDEYTECMDRIVLICRTLASEPLEVLLNDVERVDSLAAVLEPLTYRDGGARRLSDQRQLLTKAIELKKLVETLGPNGEPDECP